MVCRDSLVLPDVDRSPRQRGWLCSCVDRNGGHGDTPGGGPPCRRHASLGVGRCCVRWHRTAQRATGRHPHRTDCYLPSLYDALYYVFMVFGWATLRTRGLRLAPYISRSVAPLATEMDLKAAGCNQWTNAIKCINSSVPYETWPFVIDNKLQTLSPK